MMSIMGLVFSPAAEVEVMDSDGSLYLAEVLTVRVGPPLTVLLRRLTRYIRIITHNQLDPSTV